MAYEKKSIRAIIEDVNSRRIYLPAIQRKYVWGDSQVTKLLDSIMLGYPIGTFLFWKVKKTIVNKKDYSMYEFIKDYHDRDMYSSRITTNGICTKIRPHRNRFQSEAVMKRFGRFWMVSRD